MKMTQYSKANCQHYNGHPLHRIAFPLWILAAILALILILPLAAQSGQSANPAMPGFNQADSDARAIEIADKVMAAAGGRENWDNTRYITWRFFGRRLHVWDKWTGDIRVETGKLTILMNINSGEGRVWKEGQALEQADSLAKYLKYGKSAWINDSYWMFLPYKLKDSGVTLKYVAEDTTTAGSPAHILQLTFEKVGDTPDNKYLVYVDRESYLVRQWDFFTKKDDAEARFSNPWDNWMSYGKIMLSDGRGKWNHSDIAVYDELPPDIFRKPAPFKAASVDSLSLNKVGKM